MNKIILIVFLCWALKSAFADENPSWYPKNPDAVRDKCNEENPLSDELEQSLKDRSLIDNPQVRNHFLCKAKGFNVYTKETGINIDRMAYTFYKTPKQRECLKPVVQDCVNKHKDESSEGGLLFKVVKCIVDIDNANTPGCKEPEDI